MEAGDGARELLLCYLGLAGVFLLKVQSVEVGFGWGGA